MKKNKRSGGIQSINQILLGYDLDDSGKYISKEFQDYGYRLAIDLDDERHKALYIKLAKEEKRELLHSARAFVMDAENVRNKAALFMWKLKQLREERKK